MHIYTIHEFHDEGRHFLCNCRITEVLVVRLPPGSLLRESTLPLIFPRFTTVDRCVLVSWVILVSGVALAFTGCHHSYLVGPGAAILALQSDPLGPGPVNDTAPLLSIAAAPVPASVTPTSDPVGQQVGRQTLPSTDQLLNGVNAGTLAIWDVLCGPQLPAAHLALVWTWDMENELYMYAPVHSNVAQSTYTAAVQIHIWENVAEVTFFPFCRTQNYWYSTCQWNVHQQCFSFVSWQNMDLWWLQPALCMPTICPDCLPVTLVWHIKLALHSLKYICN